MDALGVSRAKVLLAVQHPVGPKTSSTFHFHPLKQKLCDLKQSRKIGGDYLTIRHRCSRSRSRASWSIDGKQTQRFIAGIVNDFKSRQEAVQAYTGRFQKNNRRTSKTGKGDVDGSSQKEPGRPFSIKESSDHQPSRNLDLSKFSYLKPLHSSSFESVSLMRDRLLAAAQKQVRKAEGWTNYFSSVDASPGTPLLPFLGNSLLGFGSIILLAVALISWWRKNQFFRKKNGYMNSSAESEKKATITGEQILGAKAAVAAPIALSLLLQSDSKKKESAEWLNMILGKVWNLYRRTLEASLVDAIQPVIDEIPEKPPYVERVVLKQFVLGDEPVTLRTIERRTSRRANDLQYHIGLRYTGNSRMVFAITLKFGFVPIKIPVAIRGLDLDGEVWVKLRLIPTEPWVGTATWAFVSLPKVTLALAPFRLLNLMAVPFLNIFLTKLLTQDVPLLFVRPNKQIVNYLKGKTAGPLAKDFKDGIMLKGFAGELSITLLEGRKLSYFPIGKTDPYVVFILGEQVIRSKRNSKTSIIGPPGAPVWNQDFRMLVVNPVTQTLNIRVRDNVGYLGLTTTTVGSIEVPLNDLQDTVPVDKILPLKRSRWFFLGQNAGELVVRLTYKAYVEDEEEAGVGDKPLTNKVWNEIGNFISQEMEDSNISPEKRQLRDKIVMSVDAQRGDGGFRFSNPLITEAAKKVNNNTMTTPVNGTNLNSNNVMEEPNNSASVKDPIQRSRADKSWGSWLKTFREDNSSLIWLAILTGVALLVALDLNLTNLFNP